jgi:O-antigen ligase
MRFDGIQGILSVHSLFKAVNVLRRSDFITRALMTLLFSYLLAVGATFNGILAPEFHTLTLGMMAVTAVGWWLTHGRRTWQRTTLDGALLLWAAAFGLSLLANGDAARRSAIALWYMGVYIGVWYALADVIGNRLVRRETLVDALLIVGVVILLFGYIQLLPALQTGSALPRPVSVFGNPNFLGAFLTVLIPLLAARSLTARSGRPVLGGYLLLALVLLVLSASRGAWLGVMAGAGVMGGLWLANHGLLTRAGWGAWWNGQTRRVRWAVVCGSVLLLLALVGVGVVLFKSLSAPGRSPVFRTELYGAALELFVQEPLTGHGLFTFGRELVRLPGASPDKPHSHAHSAVLQIAAELGMVGLLALAVSAWAVMKAARRHWQVAQGRERVALAGAVGAVVAFAVHHLTDLPAMMPAIALCGVLALALVAVPPEPLPMQGRWRQVGHPLGMAALWGGLLLTGWWSSGIYKAYVRGLEQAQSGDFSGAALALDPVIAADPALSLYRMEQGFLWGMAAANGEAGAREKALVAYEAFLQQEPGYALAWANRAALLAQGGDRQAALDSMRQAAQLDPDVWQYALNVARYAAAVGDTDAAGAALDSILAIYPEASLYPGLDDLAAQRQNTPALLEWTVPAQIALRLVSGHSADTVALLPDLPLPQSASGQVLTGLVMLAQEDVPTAESTILTAERQAAAPEDVAWAALGQAWLARAAGDADGVQAAQTVAETALQRGVLAADDLMLLNIAYAQFLHLTIERQFLPGVVYPVGDPVLLYLLRAADSAPAN